MRAWQILRYGPLNQSVVLRDVPQPQSGPTDLLIQVAAASINPIDFKFARGGLRPIQKLTLPASFGFDASGTVVAGSGDFAVGEEVFVRLPRQRMGAFAEYLAVDTRYVARKPAALTHQEAASLPLVGLTTVQALVDRAQLQAGQRVLIQAGSGGLGSFAVQYAKNVLSAEVVTTTSSRNADWVAALGADRVICYDREDYRIDRDHYDVVFDTLGGAATAASFGVVKRGGSVVSVAGPPDRQMADQVGAGPIKRGLFWLVGLPIYLRAWLKSASYHRFLTESNGAQLSQIANAVEQGRIRPVIDRVFPFEECPQALEYAASGRARGKVVLSSFIHN